MKIILTQELKHLNGESIKDGENNGNVLTLGKALAYILQYAEKETNPLGSLKSFILMQKLYTEQEMEIDDSDLRNLKAILETDKKFSPVISGQLLSLLD